MHTDDQVNRFGLHQTHCDLFSDRLALSGLVVQNHLGVEVGGAEQTNHQNGHFEERHFDWTSDRTLKEDVIASGRGLTSDWILLSDRMLLSNYRVYCFGQFKG